MALPAPKLFTFDFFGTVLDWRKGLRDALAARGRQDLTDEHFDRLIDLQGELELEDSHRLYADIVADSLVRVLELDRSAAEEIGAKAGTWPLYPDSKDALASLMRVAPCAAMTNSDVAHGRDVRAQLGFELTHWICAEELRIYKPSPEFWRKTSQKLNIEPGPEWWHASAYADYDLDVSRALGLTTVFVERPHARPGRADLKVRSLKELAGRFEARE